MTYRVLIGIGEDDLAATLRARFRELPDCAIVAIEPTSNDLMAIAGSDPELDVVLMHENLGPSSATETMRGIAMRHPHLAIILIVDDASPEILAQAMEAGARGVLNRDASVEEIQARVSAAADWSQSVRQHIEPGLGGQGPGGRRGTVVALAGAKGGTGTTLVTVQLAMAAVAAGRTVCLIDLDLQTGDIPSYLDLTHRRSITDLVDVADDINAAVLAETLYVHPAGPHVLLAPAEGEKGEDVNARVVRQIVGSLRTRYDVLLIDCGSYMTDASAMAVEVADTVVLTTTPDLPSLRAGKRLAKMWSRLQIRKEDEVKIALLKHSRRNEIQPDFATKIIGIPILSSTIPADFRAMEQAVNTGNPAAIEDETFRRSIGALAMEIGVVQPVVRRSGGLRRSARDDRGAAIVEFAGLVPMLGLALLLIWQLIILGLTAMYASHAANEGARAAAVLGTSDKYCNVADGKKELCDTWKAVRKKAVKRIAKPFYDDRHFDMKMSKTQLTVSIDAPAVLPGIHTPWPVSATARIVDETGGGGVQP